MGWRGRSDQWWGGGAIGVGVGGGEEEYLVAGGGRGAMGLGWVRVERKTGLGGMKKKIW